MCPTIDVNEDVDATEPPRHYPTPETAEGRQALEQFRVLARALRERLDPIAIGRELVSLRAVYIQAYPETAWSRASPNHRGSVVEPFHAAAAAELRVGETTVRNYMWLAEGITPEQEVLIPDELRTATSYLLPLVKEHDPEVRQQLWHDLEHDVRGYKTRVKRLREVNRRIARHRRHGEPETNEAVLRPGGTRRFVNRRDGVDFTLEVIEVTEDGVRLRWHTDPYSTEEVQTGEDRDWSDVLDDPDERYLERLRRALGSPDVSAYIRNLPREGEDERSLDDAPTALRPFETVGNLRTYALAVEGERQAQEVLDLL